jgi:hypothetical protein
MPYTFARLPAAIDKAKNGRFNNASEFTTMKKTLAISDSDQSEVQGVKNEISRAKASPGFSVLHSMRLATTVRREVTAKITKTST